MHEEINSLDIRRFMHAYFGQLKARCACFPRNINLSANERKRSSRCIAMIGLRFNNGNDRLDSDFLQILLTFAFHYKISK